MHFQLLSSCHGQVAFCSCSTHGLCANATREPYTHAHLQAAHAVLGLSLPTDLDILTKPQNEQAQRALPRAAIVEHATQLAGVNDHNRAWKLCSQGAG